nr:MIP family channel protein [Motilibacter peucedani]
MGELCAEFAGTMVLILFGVGVVAQVVAGGNGDANAIHWAWGFGVTFGVYVAARLSGAHLNPAVTITLAVFRGFEWRKVLPYSLAQTAGAFVAALLVRWNYSEVLAKFDPSHGYKSQGIFATQPGVSLHMAVVDEVIGSAILLFGIFAIVDARNTSPLANIGPVVTGFLVVAIGMAWGVNSGYAINPARDFGPRLAESITGFSHAWTSADGTVYFWVPIVAPVVGGLIGGGLYDLLVGKFLPIPDEEEEPGRGTPDRDTVELPASATV